MSEKMKAIAVMGVKDVQIIECDRPKVAAHEVLIQSKVVSLCTVEQRSYLGIRGAYPMIGGHEAAGIVVEVGEGVTGCKAGDHVVPCYGSCGECDYCKLGLGTQCRNTRGGKPRVLAKATVIGGGMAQYLVVPKNQVYKVDPNLPLEYAALTEPLACCIHSVNKTRVNFGDTVAIIGAGIMGILQTLLCRMRGARVVVSEVDPARRQKALDNGANLVFNPLEKNPVEYVKSITNGFGADVVINTTALSSTWEQAIQMVAPCGRIMMYSSQHPDDPIPVKMGDMHSREYEMIGTVNPSPGDFVMASRLMSYGLIDMEQVISRRFTFEQCADAFAQACVPGTYRVQITHED